MKQFFKSLIGTLVVIGLVVGAVVYLGDLLKPNFIGDAYNTIDAFHSLPEDSLDAIVFGSSRAWKGFKTSVLTDEYGLEAYNYGCNWQHINTTALFIKDALRTQSPKFVIIEAGHVGYVLRGSALNGEILYTRRIDWFDGKEEYLKQSLDQTRDQRLSYLIPFIAYHGNWNALNYSSFIDPTDNYSFQEQRGYLMSTAVETVDVPPLSSLPNEAFNEHALQVLDGIIEACREKGAQVIFYTAPAAVNFTFHYSLSDYAAANDCAFIDFYEHFEAAGLNAETDFQDGVHLNDSGSAKVADYIGKYITENYDLSQMPAVKKTAE